MSEWTPPAGATPQDFPGQPRDGVAALVQRTRDAALEMRDRFNNLLKNAGISVEPGKLIIAGDLEVVGGIQNDQLASPVTYGSDKTFSAGDATTTVSTLMATASIVVPEGYTKALVTAFSDGMAVNSTGSADYLYVKTTIGAYSGGENYTRVDAGTADGTSHTATTDLTGLVGGDTIQCGVYTRTLNAGWAANAANLWRVQAAVLFSR